MWSEKLNMSLTDLMNMDMQLLNNIRELKSIEANYAKDRMERDQARAEAQSKKPGRL